MSHPPCSCPAPTDRCPLHGFMLGHLWERCRGRGVTEPQRQAFLDGLARRGWAPAAPPPEPPPWWKRAAHLGLALARHAFDRFRHVDETAYQRRLTACLACDRLLPDRTCAECGCPVDEKCGWRSEGCPRGKWPVEAAPGQCGGCGAK